MKRVLTIGILPAALLALAMTGICQTVDEPPPLHPNWTVLSITATASLDTSGWGDPPHYWQRQTGLNRWPDSLRISCGVDAATTDTIRIRYDDWESRMRGYTLREVTP